MGLRGQSTRPTLIGSMTNEQSQFSIDAARDLPPKSPGSRHAIPTKVKRGEVKIYFECNDRCVN